MTSELLIPSLTHSCLRATRTCVCASTVEVESETGPLLKKKNKTKRKVFGFSSLNRFIPPFLELSLQTSPKPYTHISAISIIAKL